jgi:hypothetical protein
LTFRRTSLAVCKKREPAGSCRQHTYYTASAALCKYAKVTKKKRKFCEKTYELEFYAKFGHSFCMLSR